MSMLNDKKVADASQDLISVMNKHYGQERLYADNAIANLISAYEYDQQSYPGFLSDVIEKVFVNAMPQLMENVEYLHDYLKERGHTRKNRGGHGSGDSYVWYIPSKREDTKIMGYSDQNLDYVVILRKSKFQHSIHVRGYRMKCSSKISFRVSAKYKDIVRCAQQTTRDKDPGTDPLWYGDFRDAGYILSYEHELLFDHSIFEKVEGAWMRMSEIGSVLFNMSSQRLWAEEAQKK